MFSGKKKIAILFLWIFNQESGESNKKNWGRMDMILFHGIQVWDSQRITFSMRGKGKNGWSLIGFYLRVFGVWGAEDSYSSGILCARRHCEAVPANVTSFYRNPSTSSILNPKTSISKNDFSQLCHPNGIWGWEVFQFQSCSYWIPQFLI